MRRLFLDIDEAQPSDVQTNSRLCSSLSTGTINEAFFDEVFDNAGVQVQDAWEAVKKADEIYIDTALVSSYFNVSSPMMFNNLLHKAIQEEIVGKKIFILRRYNAVQWGELRAQLVEKGLGVVNELYVHDEDCTRWVRVNIEKLIKEELW